MGCLLILISPVLFFIFPLLGIAAFLVGLVVMVMNRRSSEIAKQTAELKRIAILSAPVEVQKAEAQKAETEEKKRKARRPWLIAAVLAFIVFVYLDWLKYESPPASSGSPTPKPAATATTTPSR